MGAMRTVDDVAYSLPETLRKKVVVTSHEHPGRE